MWNSENPDRSWSAAMANLVSRLREILELSDQRAVVRQRLAHESWQWIGSYRRQPVSPLPWPPKTAGGYRRAPLSPSYAQVVAEHLDVWNRNGRAGVHRAVAAACSENAIAETLRPILSDHSFPAGRGMHVFQGVEGVGREAPGRFECDTDFSPG